MNGPKPRYGRNLIAVAAHFRRAGAHRDVRISQLEHVAAEEIAEWWELHEDVWRARRDVDGQREPTDTTEPAD